MVEPSDFPAKRIIPCLDVDRGRVVKGVRFVAIKDAGDPVEVARNYEQQGADEIAFLDITASHDERDILVNIVEQVASEVFVPLTVGGGLRTLDDMRHILAAGADKVSINTAALRCPELITEAARHFGSQCVVIAVDARRDGNGWRVYTHGGRHDSGIDAIDWVQQAAAAGAGEILLTSMDRDGTKQGFDLELTAAVSNCVDIPLIASGGVGNLQHLVDGVTIGQADAVLAASIFHFGHHTIAEAKQYLSAQGVSVRQPLAATISSET